MPFECVAVDFVVIDNKDTAILEGGADLPVCARERFEEGIGLNMEAELAAFSGAALNRYVATHHPHQLLADGKPQSGATKPSCRRRVCLRETLEEAGLGVFGNADAGVAYTDFKNILVARNRL